MESPLTNLSNVLATVRDSAASYETTLRKNEAATRAALIDPVLRALGWDIANPFMVEVETGGTFENKISADYALKTDGEIQIVVEAKKLGTDLTSFYQQAVKYSFGFGVKQVFLTDGIVWEHFTEFVQGNLNPAKRLDLRSDDLEEIAAYLVQELDAALISPQRDQIDLLSEQVDQLREEIEKLRNFEERLATLEASSERKQVEKDLIRDDDSWALLKSLSEIQGTKPSNLRLPDGSEVIVKAWGQVLLECCRYVLEHSPDMRIPLLNRAGKKTNLIQAVPYPKNLNSKEISVAQETFYVCVNYRADTAVENALYILDLLDSSHHTVEAAVVYE